MGVALAIALSLGVSPALSSAKPKDATATREIGAWSLLATPSSRSPTILLRVVGMWLPRLFVLLSNGLAVLPRAQHDDWGTERH
jgi:hypothetical protein